MYYPINTFPIHYICICQYTGMYNYNYPNTLIDNRHIIYVFDLHICMSTFICYPMHLSIHLKSFLYNCIYSFAILHHLFSISICYPTWYYIFYIQFLSYNVYLSTFFCFPTPNIYPHLFFMLFKLNEYLLFKGGGGGPLRV